MAATPAPAAPGLASPAATRPAMKGVLPREEITALEAADPGVRVSRVVKLHVPRLDAERHLVLIELP